jgi:hypothetical protein
LKKPTINLGCGRDTWGDVRVDVSSNNSAATLVLDFDKQHLPFPDKHFSECRLWHVLEHSHDPQKLLSEAMRISDLVHAKFPYKWNRIPTVLSMATNFVSKDWIIVWHDLPFMVYHDTLTLWGFEDHPMAHRWLVQPCGEYRLNRLPLFRFIRPNKITRKLKLARLAELFRALPMTSMSGEWECWVG